MKHFVNILVLLILVGLGIGLAYWIYIIPKSKPTETQDITGILWLPWIIMFGAWLNKLDSDY